MVLKISETTFRTGPDDSQKAVDVYGTPSAKPINNFTEVVGKIHLTDKLSKTNLLGNVLKDIGKSYATTGRFNFNDTLKGVCKNMGITTPNLHDLKGTAMDSLAKSYGVYNSPLGNTLDGIVKAAGGDSLQKTILGGGRDVKLLIGNVKTNVKRIEDIKSFSGLVSLIDSTSGDNAFIKAFHLTDTLSMFKGIAGLANEFSIPGVFDKLLSKYTDSDKKDILKGTLNDPNFSYDLGYLDIVAGSLNTQEIYSSNPNIISDVLSNFKPTLNDSVATSELCDKLIHTLEKIDSRWNMKYFGNRWITNYDVFKSSSWFTRECFKIKGVYQTEQFIADNTVSESQENLAKACYPYALI